MFQPTDTITDTVPTPTDSTALPVRVAVFGGDEHVLDYREGMTVQDALSRATVASVDGKSVMLNDQPANLTDTVEPNATITVANKVTNG